MLQIWEGIVYGTIALLTVPCKGIILGFMTTVQDILSETVARIF
ncbi:MAG: hypothetical protein MASP_00538 [Candidatus Methanolliviera sp. GoM_asphalt]|nr:MAG: hypothetical protein MASP_00538 [Candidatus Methanolliviera sp. GoM_asphalt]